jgi:hypothetical protein
MSDTSDAGLWYALNRLETDYWWDVDLNSGRNAHEFYLPDGLYVVGRNKFAGHDQIRAFYAWRARRGPMTSRHLINNLKVSATDDHHARLVAAYFGRTALRRCSSCIRRLGRRRNWKKFAGDLRSVQRSQSIFRDTEKVLRRASRSTRNGSVKCCAMPSIV